MNALVALALGLPLLALAALPLLYARRLAWPSERADRVDDVARAVSSIRDLEFARAAGTVAPADYERLRAALERSASAHRSATAPGRVPVATLAIASLAAAVIAVVVAASLPRDLGERDPGGVLTGGGGGPLGSTTTQLEAQLGAERRDIPTLLALADAYEREGRVREAVGVYQEVLAIDRDNVPALNALGAILIESGEPAGALVAVDRVLALRPRDADALLLKGVALYEQARYADAVAAWTTFLEVAEYHQSAPMVRTLIEEARLRAR